MSDQRVVAHETDTGLPSGGVLRRMGAALYDVLVLAGVLFFAAFPLPMLSESVREAFAVRLLIQAYLAAIVIVYFAGLWVHSGQTVGMRAWRLKLINRADGLTPGWGQALRRLLFAPLAWAPAMAGILWIWFDRERLAWHDRMSNTALVVTPVPPPRRRAADSA